MTSAPSTSFSAVLRRSKFASFDPAIAQVYTTYGGDAHRGNWGLKRPLPNRRRGGMITVSAIDSPHQQTEWKTGEPQARWAMQFREVGRDPSLSFSPRDDGFWSKRIGQAAHEWQIDSEYARLQDGVQLIQKEKLHDVISPSPNNSIQPPLDATIQPSNNVPNSAAMTDAQFAQYERKLRTLRKEFKDFVETHAKDSKSAGDARSPHSPQSENAVRMFLQQQSGKDYVSSARNGLIEQKPHPRAGLSYAHVPPIQAYFASDPLPGRILGQASGNSYTSLRNGFYAGFAGMRAFLELRHTEGLRPARAGQPPTPTRFRVENAQLERAPRVVGRSQTALDGTSVFVSVQSWSEHEQLRTNPHKPGSREWVAHQPSTTLGQGRAPTFFGAMRPTPQMDAPPPPRLVSNEDIVASLRALILKRK